MSSTGEIVIHFNHAGASPSPLCVIDKLVQHLYLEEQLGGYAAAAEIQSELYQVYALTARLLNAKSALEIGLVESATVAWTRLFYSMVEYHERTRPGGEEDKVILVSEAEYAAQIVAATKWAREHDGWKVVAIPSTLAQEGSSAGVVDLGVLEQMLKGNFNVNGKPLDPTAIAVVCITHIPTNSGIINPVEQIGELLRQYRSAAFYLVDACQSVGQIAVDVEAIQCHGLCGTGRKYLRAPRGTGFLYIDSATASKLQPSHVDHESAPIITVPSSYPGCEIVNVEYELRPGAKRFEFWESSAASRLGFGEAVRYALEYTGGMTAISEKIRENALRLQERLVSINNVLLYYPGTVSGIVTFHTPFDSEVIKEFLWAPNTVGKRFEVSVVPATSTPLDSARTKVKNLVRTSVSYTTTADEIEALGVRLEEVLSSTPSWG